MRDPDIPPPHIATNNLDEIIMMDPHPRPVKRNPLLSASSSTDGAVDDDDEVGSYEEHYSEEEEDEKGDSLEKEGVAHVKTNLFGGAFQRHFRNNTNNRHHQRHNTGSDNGKKLGAGSKLKFAGSL